MAPDCDDSRWRSGQLREKNSIPEWKSRLYRVPIRVSAPPGPGETFILSVEADDGLQVWLDGFKLGAWGNGAKPTLSGRQTLDLSQQLTVGDHVLALRVDNGIADSSLIADLRVISEDSPDALTVGDWFRTNFNSPDERLRTIAIERARKLAKLHPADQPTLWAAFDTYAQADPPNIQAAWETIAEVSRLGATWHCAAAPLIVDVGDYALMDNMLRRTDWSGDRSQFQRFNRGRMLMLTAKRDEALIEFETALQRLQEVPQVGWRADFLIEIGLLDKVVPALHRAEGTARRITDTSGLVSLEKSFRKLGDYKRSKSLLSQLVQTNRQLALGPLSELALLTGDFAEAERLSREALASVEVTPTRGTSLRQELLLRLATALSAQGKETEAKEVCAKIDVGPFPGQPAWTLTAIRMTHHPRLQIARISQNKQALRETAQALYDALKVRATNCPCRDVEPRVLADLALARHESGMTAEASHVSTLIRTSVANIAIPANQVAPGAAALVLGDKEAARRHYGDAALYAPEDWWIRMAATTVSGR